MSGPRLRGRLAGFRKLLWQPQRDGHRETRRLNWLYILRRAKSRPRGISRSGIDIRWTEIRRGHLGMGSGGGCASRSGTGAVSGVLACGTGGIGIRRDKPALVEECDLRCGTCATLAGEELVGGMGGTGSFSAHTGGQISSNRKTSLCRRFDISVSMRRPTMRCLPHDQEVPCARQRLRLRRRTGISHAQPLLAAAQLLRSVIVANRGPTLCQGHAEARRAVRWVATTAPP